MKKLQHIALASVLAGSAVLPMTASAEVSLSGNAGILSDYIFRGIQQSTGTANGGLDLEWGGFYAGTWIADVGTGVEYDIYAGYIHEFANGFYLGAGWTEFQYSDGFDGEFHEWNSYAGWSNDLWSLDLEFSGGEHNAQPGSGADAFTDSDGNGEGDDYNFFAATLSYNGIYLTYGTFGEDAEDEFGEYFETGYGFEVAGFDVTAAVVFTDIDDDPVGNVSDDDGDETSAYVGISRSFDIAKWGSGS